MFFGRIIRKQTLFFVAVVLGALAFQPRAAKAGLDLGIGADYWLTANEHGIFSLTLTPRTYVARQLAVGARFGAALITDPTDVAIPLDLQLRLRFSRAYAELNAGPWLLFDYEEVVHAHVGFGFGLATGNISLGLEVGWLDPDTILGIRLGFPI